jgi:hypothetical protein
MTEPKVSESRAPHSLRSSGALLEIFDPPMCCPTGMCGPTVDPTLLAVNEMVLALKDEGIEARRYQMSAQPQAFVSNPQVYQLLRERQMAALPVTVLNGRVLKVGGYPTLDQVRSEIAKDGS